MKLKVGKKVYLQEYEIAFIARKLSGFPASILQEALGDNDGNLGLMDNPMDCFRFGYVFEDPKNVKWLMNQDWILDYRTYARRLPIELEVLRDNLEEKLHAAIKAFNARDETYRKKHFDGENERLDKMSHKIDSIEAMIDHRRGKVEFVFPDDYQARTILRVKHGFLAWLFGQSAQ